MGLLGNEEAIESPLEQKCAAAPAVSALGCCEVTGETMVTLPRDQHVGENLSAR